MNNPSTPSERIKWLMSQEGINQRELGSILNYDESTVSKHLDGKSEPSIKFMVRLEDMLYWSCRWMRTGKGPQRWTNEVENKPVDVNQFNKGVELLEQAVESLKAAVPQQFPK